MKTDLCHRSGFVFFFFFLDLNHTSKEICKVKHTHQKKSKNWAWFLLGVRFCLLISDIVCSVVVARSIPGY